MRGRRVAQVAGLAGLVGFVVVLGVAVQRAQNKGSFPRQILQGQRPAVPAFSLASLGSGDRISLADYRGKPLVINFWAAWCTECADEAPLLRQVATEQIAAGVAFLGIDYKDTREGAASFLERYQPPYPSVSDDGGTSDRFGVTGVPETYVIDRSGHAVAWFSGPIDPDALRAAIREASA